MRKEGRAVGTSMISKRSCISMVAQQGSRSIVLYGPEASNVPIIMPGLEHRPVCHLSLKTKIYH
jgi:hypothetical protein